ncbi:MAG: VWA domain-containing protein, partial [Pseudomonadota bacterium]
MTDDLDQLRAALRDQPEPEASRKAEHLNRAMAAFEEFHDAAKETLSPARPTSDRPIWGRVTEGLGHMLQSFSSKAGLMATSGLVAASLGAIVYLGIVPVGLDTFDRRISMEPEPSAPLTPAPALKREQRFSLPDEAADAVAPAFAITGNVEVESVGGAQLSNNQAPSLNDQLQGLALSEAPLGEAEMSAKSARRVQRTSRETLLLGTDVQPPSHASTTEAFANEAPNPLKITVEEPVSTFSVDVDTASYAVVRQSLMAGRMPTPEAVRVEEMINYFPYDYPAPEADAPFEPTLTVTETPWNDATRLVHIALQGDLPAIDDRPPLNLVFLIDTSGSMSDANKLPLLQQSLRLMLTELRPEDEVSIVTYAGSAGQVLEPTSDPAKITAALSQLQSGGSTAGQAGLQQAYAVAEAMAAEGEVTRVILATDGDFNVGLSDPDALKTFIAEKRESGTYLSVLGFGRGNLDDATMQALAQNGNGTAAYIDTLSEARKVLVDQLSGALFPIAGDVKVQIEWNPAQVAEYRLIGYETRALRREDFNNDTVDAGDIGAGHRVTALYEVTPVGSDAVLNDPLRYQTADAGSASGSEELGFLRLRWKAPGATESQLIEAPIEQQMGA